MTFYLYEPSGRITTCISASDADGYRAFLVEQNTPFVETEAESTLPFENLYVTNGELAEKPLHPEIAISGTTLVANGTDEVTVSGAPTGTEVWLDGQSEGTADGPITITAVEARNYVLHIVPPMPWRQQTWVITATEPTP